MICLFFRVPLFTVFLCSLITIKFSVQCLDGLSNLLCWCITWGGHHMGAGPLCHLHCLSVCLNLEAILVHRLIQAGGNSPKRTTAPTGGPSSVMAELPLPEKADRQSERQVGRQAEGKALQGAGDWAPYARASQRIQAGMCPLCKPAGTHSQACQWPQPAQADVFWVLLFRFSGNCFPSGPASGTRCQVVLWEGVTQRWKDRVYYQSLALKAVLHRRSILSLVLHVGRIVAIQAEISQS